jgi:hypothetical protein
MVHSCTPEIVSSVFNSSCKNSGRPGSFKKITSRSGEIGFTSTLQFASHLPPASFIATTSVNIVFRVIISKEYKEPS